MSLVDTLKAQGKASDYQSRKGLYEGMGLDKQYGSYGGTAQQNIAFENLLKGGQPSPNQAMGTPLIPQAQPQSGGQPNWMAGIDTSKMTPLQQQYIKAYQNVPNEGDLFTKYSQEMGINQSQDIITGLNKSIMDLEDKITKVEGDVNQRTSNFMVTEAQRRRIQNVEEKPLRDQYLESLRRKQYEEAGLSAKQDLLNTRLKYAMSAYQRPLDLMQTMIGWETSKAGGAPVVIDIPGLTDNGNNKKNSTDDQPPEWTPDDVFDTVFGKMEDQKTLDQSATLKTKPSTKKQSMKKEANYSA